MIRIGRFPPFCKSLFRRARKLVGSCQLAHLWRVVVALASVQGHRSLSRIESLTKDRRTRQAISHFLTRAQWDAPELLRQTALDTLRKLGFRPGDTIYIVLDDTQVRKRAKRMDAVSKIFLHAEKVYAHGHTVLGCALIYRNVVIPYSVAVWTPRLFAGRPFRKLTEMAGDAVRAVSLPAGARGIVLFDAYYLCPAVREACQERSFPYVGATKKNRNFRPDGRPRDARKLSRYGRQVLDRAGLVRRIGKRRLRVAERVGELSKAGRVKLVFNRGVRERTWRCLVSNYTRWSSRTILEHYFVRWGIELLFKMSKQHLGLGDYQLLRYTGVVRYLHLVLIAYLLLTHLALREPDVQALLNAKGPLRLPGTLHLQSSLRTQLCNDAIRQMGESRRYRAAARKLRQIIQL
jgi:SRSO17 transposase